jgi:hypothetical protein
MADQKTVVQAMIDAGESEDNIALVIKHFATTSKESPKTWWEEHPRTAALAHGALNTLPAAGALVGGALASPTLATGLPGLAAEAGAVGLGAGAGMGARDLIAQGIGLEKPSSVGTKAARIGGETAMGAATAAVVPGAIEAAKTPLKTLGGVLKLPAGIRKLLWSGQVSPELELPSSAPEPILSRAGDSGRVDMSPEAPPPKVSVAENVPASRSRTGTMSATPGFTVEDIASVGGNPNLKYTGATLDTIKDMLAKRAGRASLHRMTGELDALERTMLER